MDYYTQTTGYIQTKEEQQIEQLKRDLALEKSISQTKQQKLIDICFSCVLTVLDKEFNKNFVKMSKEEQAEWTARQLRECGFDTEPLGCKWGVMKENK